MRTGWSLRSGTALLVMLFAIGGQEALAQSGRTWVDPPAEPGTPAAPSPQASEPPSPAPQDNGPAPAPQTAAPPPAAAPAEPAAPPTRSAEPSRPTLPPEEPAPRRRPAQPSQSAPPTVTAQPGEADEKQAARTQAARAFAVDYLNLWSASNEEALEATVDFYAPQVLYHGRTVSMRTLFNEKRRFARRWPERDYRPRPDSMGVVCNPPGDICTVHMVFDYVAANPARRSRSGGSGALQLIVHFIGDKPVIVAEHSTVLGQNRSRNLRRGGTADD